MFLRTRLLVRIAKRILTHGIRQPGSVKFERWMYWCERRKCERRMYLLRENLKLRRPTCSLRRRRIRKRLARILAHRSASQYESNHSDGCHALNHTQAL